MAGRYGMDELAVFGIEGLFSTLLPLPFPYRTQAVGPVDIGDQRGLIDERS